MRFNKASGVATGMLAASAFALVAASMAPAEAAKKSRDECIQLANQRGFTLVKTRAEAEEKRLFIVACMQGKQS
jgi:predicted amidohydrolase YtcJ